MDKSKQIDEIWLDGYNLEKLNELQEIYQPIEETGKDQYRPYFEFANGEYTNVKFLKRYIHMIKELLVSNYGHIKYNGRIISSTLVADGPNRGINGGKYDHYREILFPDISIKSHAFFTYRLVAEVWCKNPDLNKYTTVHHIGNDSYDNKNNLLFVTNKQHFLIIHNKSKKPIKKL